MTSGQISLCNFNITADVALRELEVKGRQVCSSEGRIDGVQRLVGCIDVLSWLLKACGWWWTELTAVLMTTRECRRALSSLAIWHQTHTVQQATTQQSFCIEPFMKDKNIKPSQTKKHQTDQSIRGGPRMHWSFNLGQLLSHAISKNPMNSVCSSKTGREFVFLRNFRGQNKVFD